MKKYIVIPVLFFIFAALLNFFRIYIEFNSYNELSNDRNKDELETIIRDTKKISDSLFENIINAKNVIKIFETAHKAGYEEKSAIRERLYKELVENYAIFTKYGVEQLHFHLPNNESFLRFHKPQKFGDDLSQMRESVAYVNKYKKATAGFEEGKIFNGYRFVYPLFGTSGEHVGSVEISSSMLHFKKLYEKSQKRHLDYIVHKSVVQQKLFASELKNYEEYYKLDDFFIRTTIAQYDRENCVHQKYIAKFFEDKNIQNKIQRISEYTFSKIIDGKIFTLNLIPLYNDFLKKKVGYKVLLTHSDYLNYFFYSVAGSFMSIFLFSILVGYLIYLNQKSMDYKNQKQKVELKSEHLLASNQLIKSVLNGTNDLIFYKDKNFMYIGCNEAFAKSLQKSNDEIIGKNDFDLFDDKTATLLRNRDNIVLKKNEVQSHYEWRTFSSAKEVYLDTQLIPFNYDEDSSIVGILGISRDMTELYRTQQDLRKQTNTDELTKILNRKAYNSRLLEMLANFKRYDTTFSVVMFDVDHFKEVNDNYGHKLGDNVLIDLCKLVGSKIRESDYFFRIGGEEFIILLNQTNQQNAVSFAENIRELVEKNLTTIENKTITISLGVSSVEENDTEDTIFSRVDHKLYDAKQGGRNRVCS